MVTIPNQSSVPKAYDEFDENGRMRPSSYYDRIVVGPASLFVEKGAITRQRLEELGGQIMVSRSGLNGALFTVIIPKEQT